MRAVTLAFRPDVEGLRAIAIFFVVSAHADLLGLAGGFTGVDVFFVLSGYLITAQLIDEQRETGQIYLFRFYARRMRRLLPAALITLLTSLLLAWQFLPPSSWQQQAQAAAAAAVWMSNLHFAFTQLDYFGGAAAENLFLHTWSLSVEEQFYLFWPLLLIAAFALAPRRREQIWPAALWLVLGSSLLACLWPTQNQPLSAFYLMPSRAWQFALGGLSWFYGGRLAKGVLPTLSAFGLILLLISGWGLHEELRYPGYWALLPSTGAALLLMGGITQQGNQISNVLSLPAAQWLGQRSYSLYLWHWPILLVGRDQLGMDSVLARIGLMLVALGLAAVTYSVVERPLRRWPFPLQKPARTVWIGVGVVVVSAVLITTLFPIKQGTTTSSIGTATLPLIYVQGCDDSYRSAELKVCAYGDPNAQHTAIVAGDSIGLQWFPALQKAFAENGWRLLAMTKSSCPMVDESVFVAAIGREFTECAQWRKTALQAIAEISPDLVIMGSTDSYKFSLSQWTEGSARTLGAITRHTKHIVVLRATPRLTSNLAECVEPRTALYKLMSFRSSCTSPVEDRNAQAVFQALQTAARRFNNVRVLDLNALVCPDGQCSAMRQGKLVFRDQQHLNAEFVNSLSGSVAAAFGDVSY